MVFATDLDNTLIHSRQRISNISQCIAVEYKNKKPISYMSKQACDFFEKLKNNENLTIIPVTARSTEQFERITITQNCPYAILAGGATILDHGEPIKDWSVFINYICDKHGKNYKFFNQYLSQNLHHIAIGPRLVNNAVIFFKLNEEENNHTMIREVRELAQSHNWHFTLQRAKGYLSPSEISKENALKFLIERLDDKNLITAGDGTMDVPFIKLGNIFKFIPVNTEAFANLRTCSSCTVIDNSINGTRYMLEQIANALH